MSGLLVRLCGSTANSVLKKVRMRLSRLPTPAQMRRIQLIRSHAIQTVIDVGANTGQYATELRWLGYAGEIVSYEPLPGAFSALKRKAANDRNWRAVPKAVSPSPDAVKLHIAGNSVSSSVLEMTNTHSDAAPESKNIGTIQVETISLANAISSEQRTPLMVKIDAQGYEKQILDSAAEKLQSVSLVELELSLVELYKGQMLFREMDSFMVGAGFHLVSIEEGFFDKRSGELLQYDGIYSRRP